MTFGTGIRSAPVNGGGPAASFLDGRRRRDETESFESFRVGSTRELQAGGQSTGRMPAHSPLQLLRALRVLRRHRWEFGAAALRGRVGESAGRGGRPIEEDSSMQIPLRNGEE